MPIFTLSLFQLKQVIRFSIHSESKQMWRRDREGIHYFDLHPPYLFVELI
jgi:hypothetical protein